MKKTLIALASVAALGAAHADVTLYGVIDVSAVHMSAGAGSDANNPGNVNFLVNPTTSPPGTATGLSNYPVSSVPSYAATTALGSGALSASRWGIKGTEDLGGGMKAGFTLESALNAATGTNPNDHALLSNQTAYNAGSGDSSANGQMFDRQATVDLYGGWGELNIGRIRTAERDATNEIDILNSAGISPIGFYGGFTGMGSSYTQVADNSLKLTTPLGSMGKAIGFYSFGGQPGTQAGSQFGGTIFLNPSSNVELIGNFGRMYDNVAYGSSPVTTSCAAGTTATYQSTAACGNVVKTGSGAYSGAYAAVTVPQLSATYYDSTQTVVGAKIQATPNLTIKLGYITVTQQNPSNAASDATQTQNLGIPAAATTNAYSTSFTRTMSTIGAAYDVSGTDHLTVAAYQINYHSYTGYSTNNTIATNVCGAAAASCTYNVNSSNINTYDIVYNHDLSKKTDVYGAIVLQQFGNTSAPNNSQSFVALGNLGLNASTVAVGLRTRF